MSIAKAVLGDIAADIERAGKALDDTLPIWRRVRLLKRLARLLNDGASVYETYGAPLSGELDLPLLASYEWRPLAWAAREVAKAERARRRWWPARKPCAPGSLLSPEEQQLFDYIADPATPPFKRTEWIDAVMQLVVRRAGERWRAAQSTRSRP